MSGADSWARTVPAAIVYAAAAWAFTWPLVRHPFALIGAADPTGDPALNLWTLAWDLRTLSSHPMWFVTGRVFDAPMFFPAPHSLAYADHLLLQAVALWPVYALTHDPVFCYNVLLIASLAAAALAMHVLVRALIGDERAAFVAGFIFGFAPYHFTHLTHIQLQALYFLPLSLLFLHRLFAAGRARDIVGLGAVMGLQMLSSAYYGVIGAVGIAVAAIALAILTRRIGDGRLLLRGLAAAALAAIVAVPWSIPYLRVEREAGAGRTLFEASHGSAVLASYLQAPATNLLYGRTRWLVPTPRAALPRKDGPEQGLFPGFVTMFLAVVGGLGAPRHLRRIAAVYAALTAAGIVLSLGPDGVRPLYVGLYHGFFAMAVVRAPARFSVLALAGLAMLAAIAVHSAALRAPRSQSAVLLLAWALVALEFTNGSIPFPAAPALTSDAARWLRSQPGSGAVVCVPMGFDTANTRCMLQGLEHGRRIVNGYGGLRPPFFPTLVDSMQELPSPPALLTLHDIGVEWVVSDRALLADGEASGALVQRAQFGDQRVYQLVWTPAIDAAVAEAAAPTPPEAGAPPFAAGESAAYRVRWTNGPVNLPAGEATIAVAPPNGREAFRFVVTASTASWVSAFYDLKAQFETTATDRLLPLARAETVVQSRRTVERTFLFDADRHEVRMTTGGSTVTLPLVRSARDPVTALFYVRTLPLEPGLKLRVPLTDNGRRSQLDVAVGAEEVVMVDGRERLALRIAPQITGRVERQEPLAIAVWVSADEHRIPLVVEVAGTFGKVRAEMVSYTSGTK